MNDAFTLYLLAAHFAGDFPLQPDWMARAKLESRMIREKHVARYTATFIPVTIIAPWSLLQAIAFLAITSVLHSFVDSRRWAEPTDEFPGRPIWFDQAYHIICLALTVGFIEVIA